MTGRPDGSSVSRPWAPRGRRPPARCRPGAGSGSRPCGNRSASGGGSPRWPSASSSHRPRRSSAHRRCAGTRPPSGSARGYVAVLADMPTRVAPGRVHLPAPGRREHLRERPYRLVGRRRQEMTLDGHAAVPRRPRLAASGDMVLRTGFRRIGDGGFGPPRPDDVELATGRMDANAEAGEVAVPEDGVLAAGLQPVRNPLGQPEGAPSRNARISVIKPHTGDIKSGAIEGDGWLQVKGSEVGEERRTSTITMRYHTLGAGRRAVAGIGNSSMRPRNLLHYWQRQPLPCQSIPPGLIAGIRKEGRCPWSNQGQPSRGAAAMDEIRAAACVKFCSWPYPQLLPALRSSSMAPRV